jgi:hypothetical protein
MRELYTMRTARISHIYSQPSDAFMHTTLNYPPASLNHNCLVHIGTTIQNALIFPRLSCGRYYRHDLQHRRPRRRSVPFLSVHGMSNCCCDPQRRKPRIYMRLAARRDCAWRQVSCIPILDNPGLDFDRWLEPGFTSPPTTAL